MESMNSLRIFFSTCPVLLSVLFLSFGCSSIPTESKRISDEVKSIQENFKIEGKFKLSNTDSKETGYFVVEKYINTVSLTIGKNYLLPEKVIVLDIRENLNLNEFIEDKNLVNNLPQIEIKSFLKLLVEENSENLGNKGIDVKLEKETFSSAASKIYLAHSDFELLIIIKNIWKS